MKKINGLKYSREEFKNYKFRAKVEITTDSEIHVLDIYTTDTDKSNVIKVLKDSSSKKVISSQIIHWVSKEQDDMTSKFIDEFIFK